MTTIAYGKTTEHKKRQNVLRELVETEKKFVSHMNEIVCLYKVPLEEAIRNGSPILREERVVTIFSNINDILSLNQNFLRDLQQIDGTDANFCIGKVMRPIAPFFKMYKMYCSNHGNAMTLIESYADRKGHKFNKFLERAAMEETSSKQSLQSLLIMPIQRLPRLKMLLERLLKYTAEDHADAEDLVTCLRCISEVAEYVNKGVTEKENRIKMWRVQRTLVPTPEDLIQPHRLYVREGYLTKVCRRTNKRWYFFLFSDILIYGYKLSGSRVQHKRTIELRRVTDLPARHNNGCAFVVFGKPKSFVLIAESVREKYEWLANLMTCCDDVEARRQKQLSMVSSPDDTTTKKSEVGHSVLEDDEAPLWVPDNFSPSCMCCGVSKFNAFTNRRHHCRKCGILVCDGCSRSKLIVHTVDKHNPVRVCNKCKLRRAQKEAERRLSPQRKTPSSEEPRSRAESDSTFEVRVPLGSRPLPPAPSNSNAVTSRSIVAGTTTRISTSSTKLPDNVRKAARNSSRNRLLRIERADEGIKENDAAKKGVSRPKPTKKTRKKKKKTNASPSLQQKKTLEALKYLTRRSPGKLKNGMSRRPSRPAPPVPVDEKEAMKEDDVAAGRSSVQRRIDALNRMKTTGSGRRTLLVKKGKKGGRRAKKLAPKLKEIMESASA